MSGGAAVVRNALAPGKMQTACLASVRRVHDARAAATSLRPRAALSAAASHVLVRVNVMTTGAGGVSPATPSRAGSASCAPGACSVPQRSRGVCAAERRIGRASSRHARCIVPDESKARCP